MKLKSSNKIEVNRYELDIEVSPEEFCAEVDKVYSKQKSKITIPGFRKGKAPRSFIEKYYGEQIFYEDAVNAIYPYALDDAAKEAGLELVDDHIDFEMGKMSKTEGLSFKVKVTVVPEVTVENYKGIEVSKKEIKEISETEIENKLKSLQEQNARLVTSDNGKAKKGDVLDINFEGTVDSVPFDGGTAENVSLEIGKNQFIEGFEEQLIGHGTNEEFEINVKFPESYHATNLASKDAVFKIKINKIQKKDLPAIDDEFVKDISEFETLDEFKKDLKEKLVKENELEANRKQETEITEKFTALVKADIPEAMIKNKTAEFVRDFEYKLESQGLKIKDYMQYTGSTADSLNETFKPRAIDSVKLSLGLKQVAKLENISVSEEELNKEYEEIAKSYQMKVEQVKKFVPADDLRKDMLSKKALQLVQSNIVEK